MSKSDNGYYGNTPEMTFQELVNTPPTNDFEAMRMALVLAITAPGYPNYRRYLMKDLKNTMDVLSGALTYEEIEAAKAEALQIVEGMDNER